MGGNSAPLALNAFDQTGLPQGELSVNVDSSMDAGKHADEPTHDHADTHAGVPEAGDGNPGQPDHDRATDQIVHLGIGGDELIARCPLPTIRDVVNVHDAV